MNHMVVSNHIYKEFDNEKDAWEFARMVWNQEGVTFVHIQCAERALKND